MGLTERQLEIRKGGIGGSELSAVLGLSPFSGPLEVYETKVKGVSNFTPNQPMKVGTMGEAALAEILGEYEGHPLVHAADYAEHPGFDAGLAEHLCDGTLRNIAYPHMLVTPDYVRQDGTALRELKIVGVYSGAKNFSRPGEPKKYPIYYDAQCQVQMLTTGIHTAQLCVAVQDGKIEEDLADELWREWEDGDPFGHVHWYFKWYLENRCEVRLYDIRYDAELARAYGERCETFWEAYIQNETPDPSWRPHEGPRYSYSRKKDQKVEGGWITNL